MFLTVSPKLPYEDGFRSRDPLSWPDDRKKSIRLPSSSSDRTRLRRRRKLPVGVISVGGCKKLVLISAAILTVQNHTGRRSVFAK